jgi:hypothetical protein
MHDNEINLPAEIKSEAGELLSELKSAGWSVETALYDARSFGNWYIDLQRAGITIRLLKDRSQYLIQGSNLREIKSAGLWKAFNDLNEFRRAVVGWAATTKPQVSS